MPVLPVSEKKATALKSWMCKLGIREADLVEKFIRSSGAGGQNVNKVATCVALSHPPSGLEIKAQTARTQGLNRYYARVRLCEKLETRIMGKRSREQQAREKLKRQKRKRSKRAKEKVLAGKRAQADKKKLRRPPSLVGE